VIVAGLGVAVLTALAISLAIGIRTVSALALATFVLTVAEIVLLIELLSGFHAVESRNLLVMQALLLGLSGVLLSRQRTRIEVRFCSGVAEALRRDWLVSSLLVVVVLGIGYELTLALFTPPNNWDSMTYHLSRAAGWYQHHGVAYIDAPNQRENANPPNAEILIMYTFALLKGDRAAALWQWFADLGSMFAIYMIARRIGSAMAEAVFAALVFACLSQVVLQSMTTQNDLIAASLVVSSVAFLVSSEPHRLFLGAAAFGLALGTKFTCVWAIPIVVAIAVVVVPRAQWKGLSLRALGATAAFGAFGYGLNLVESGSLLGPPSATSGLSQHDLSGFAGTAGRVALHLVVDMRGLGLSDLPASEDASYFGLLGAVVIAPIVILTLARRVRGSASRLEMILALSIPLYIVGLAATNAFNPFMGRFLLTPVALVAPLFGRILRIRFYAVAVTAMSMFTLASNLVLDHAKPSGLTGGTSIWALTRDQAQTLQQPALLPMVRALSTRVPTTARIGYVLGGDDWDYPLYGPGLARKLVQLDPQHVFSDAAHLHLQWILVRRSKVGPIDPAWQATRFPSTGLMLLHRSW
jgi:hypothetical protein